MSDALVVIDMQVGSFGPDNPPRYDLDGLIARLNALAAWVRSRGGVVIWVHHDGAAGDVLEPGTDGWRLLPALKPAPGDETIRKTACDSFLSGELEPLLRERGVSRVIVTGWATDFCVDTTVRASTARGFATCAPSDGHTASDRPHLEAARIIEHHNAIWAALLAPGGTVDVSPCAALMARG